mmetsp:Transcript_23290/g.66243  ORF Transcript_23290/g.66243 Transcript_23290/m.66243 type:complete len:84 (+) Transcript_23290:582-833(+)
MSTIAFQAAHIAPSSLAYWACDVSACRIFAAGMAATGAGPSSTVSHDLLNSTLEATERRALHDVWFTRFRSTATLVAHHAVNL